MQNESKRTQNSVNLFHILQSVIPALLTELQFWLKSPKIALSRGEFRRVTDSRNLDLVFLWQLYPYQPEALFLIIVTTDTDRSRL